MQLFFYMFFTLMSLKDRLRLKLKVKTHVWLNAGQPMAIPIYTVLPYCVIVIPNEFSYTLQNKVSGYDSTT